MSEPTTGDGAKAGTGAPPKATEPNPQNQKAKRPKQKRPKVVLEHPDTTGPEFTIRRSFRIQDGIERFLEENVDTSWENLQELYVRAANSIWHTGLLKRRPSSVTAQRWIQQYTAVGERYRIREVPREGYWMLERRE
jgi:hypothetical protein